MSANEQSVDESLQPLLEVVTRDDLRAWPALASRLEQVIKAAVPVLHVHSVGLMLLDDANLPRVAGVADEVGLVLEAAQVEVGQGPGIDSLRTGATVAVADLSEQPGYAQLWQRVRSHALRAVLSSPVCVDGSVIGNFNAVLQQPHTWSDTQVRANDTYAHVIGLALSITAQEMQAEDRVSQLRARLAVSNHLGDAEDYQ